MQWRIQGAVWGNFPPNGCGTPFKWRPSNKNAPLFGAYRSKNKHKKYNKYAFRVHETAQTSSGNTIVSLLFIRLLAWKLVVTS